MIQQSIEMYSFHFRQCLARDSECTDWISEGRVTERQRAVVSDRKNSESVVREQSGRCINRHSSRHCPYVILGDIRINGRPVCVCAKTLAFLHVWITEGQKVGRRRCWNKGVIEADSDDEYGVSPSLKCLLIPKQVSCLFPSLCTASSIDRSDPFISPCAVMRDGETEINAKRWRREKRQSGKRERWDGWEGAQKATGQWTLCNKVVGKMNGQTTHTHTHSDVAEVYHLM